MVQNWPSCTNSFVTDYVSIQYTMCRGHMNKVEYVQQWIVNGNTWLLSLWERALALFKFLMEDIILCCVLSVDKRERNNIIKQDSRNFFTGSSTVNSSFTEEYQGDLRNSFRFVFFPILHFSAKIK